MQLARPLSLICLAALALSACKKDDPPPVQFPSTTTSPTEPRPMGPGLGNTGWTDAELFQPVSFIDHQTGVPPSTNPLRVLKPFATNVAAMHNGWMVVPFASDSGLSGGGLLIYDVSDVRAPQLVNTVFQLFADGREERTTDVPVPETFDGATGHFREQHAFGLSSQGGRDLVMFHSATGIQIWDFTNTPEPQPYARLDLPGVEGGDYIKVSWQLAWQGGWAYVASSEQGIFVIDTRDPANPVLADRGGAPNPIPPGETGGFRIGSIFAMGNQLVVSSMDTTGGYGVLDISDPAHPTLMSAKTTGFDKFYSTCFTGDRIVGSERGAGAEMWVHDLSDPYDPRPVGDPVAIDEQLYCAGQDGFVFQGNEHDFAKVDVRDPANFREVGRGHIERPNVDHGQVTPFGNAIFIGNDHGTGSAFFPHQAEPDTAPPEVVAVSPADGATHVAPTSRIGIAFTDHILNTSLTAEGLVIRELGGDPVDGVFSVHNHVVNFTPAEPLTAGASYQVELLPDGLTDWVGNPTAPGTAATFTVSPLGGDGDLDVVLDPLGPVPVGQSLTLSATVTGSPVELSWRTDEDSDWTPFSSATTLDHTWTEPGHTRVFVRATNGARTVVDSAPVTVHRPLAGTAKRSSAIAIAGDTAWVANRDNGTVSRVDLATGSLVDETPVGATPSAIAVDANGTAWVALLGDDGLAEVSPTGGVQVHALAHGSRPCGLLADNGTLVVSESGTGDLVTLDSRVVETGRVGLAPGICGLARAPDGRLLASELRGTESGARVHVYDGATTGRLTLAVDDTTVDAEDRARGVPGFLGAPAVDPSGTRAWIPATQANIERGNYRDGQDLTHETSVRAVLPQLDLDGDTELAGRRLDFNDRAQPMAAVTSPLGDYVYVALMGSNEVAIVDAYSRAVVGGIPTGAAPRELALTPDGSQLLVHAWLDRTLEIYDVSGVADGTFAAPQLHAVPLVGSEALSAPVLEGKRIFHDASDLRMSQDGYLSCASCHLDGAHDGLTWDFTERGEGLRNTTDLRGRAGLAHGPVHWTANFDEIQDFENDIRGGFGGAGFLADADFHAGTTSDPLGDPKAGLSPELDALAAYVSSLDSFPASPHRNPDGSMTAAALRGEALFLTQGCDRCHAGAAMTDSGADLHDVGTLTAASGQRRSGPLTGLDTPTLRGLWDGGPWLHDGSAPAVSTVLVDANPSDQHGVTSPLTAGELADLEAYLLELE